MDLCYFGRVAEYPPSGMPGSPGKEWFYLMNRKISVSVAMAITLVAITVTFSITMIVSMKVFDNTVSSVMQKQAFYDKISEVDKYVRANYYGTIDDNLLQNRTARGYIDGIGDPYSVYYTKEDYNEILSVSSGDLVDIGVELTKSPNGYFQIMKVYPDSPAAKSGIVAMGWITEVDGKDTSSVTTVKAMQKLLRGAPGTVLNITYVRDAAFIEEEYFTIQRDNYSVPTVELLMEDGYAYVRISTVSKKTYTEFTAAVNRAENNSAKGIIFDLRNFDLRNNAADQFDEVYKMIDEICPLGTVARVQGKDGEIKTLSTSDGETFVDLPMVVLVDNNTAAAAELFAACVRDFSKGQLVGVKTAGWGTMQNSPQKLSDGSALSITYGILLAGTSGSFDVVGLEPDIEVASQNTAWNYTPDFQGDIQLVRAMELARSMARGAGTEDATGQTDNSGSDASPEGVEGEGNEIDAGEGGTGEADSAADAAEDSVASERGSQDGRDSSESDSSGESQGGN